LVDALRLATYSAAMPLPHGFVPPCLPITAPQLPSGDTWVHEIKHDGFRLMARRDSAGIRLLTQNGHDWSPRYSLIREAVNRKVRSCLIDGKAVACDENGLAVFERLRRKREGRHVFLYAFDLMELNGTDLRREPTETRRDPATITSSRRDPPGDVDDDSCSHEENLNCFGRFGNRPNESDH
jgi:bifunctional non-homologous end joining protein LigD